MIFTDTNIQRHSFLADQIKILQEVVSNPKRPWKLEHMLFLYANDLVTMSKRGDGLYDPTIKGIKEHSQYRKNLDSSPIEMIV